MVHIAVYNTNDNDMQLIGAEYTNFDFSREPDGYGDNFLPRVSANTSPSTWCGRAQNIGGGTSQRGYAIVAATKWSSTTQT